MRDRRDDEREISEVEKALSSWLNPFEVRKHKWALNYLIAKGMIDSKLDLSPPLEIILNWSRGRRYSPIIELLIKNMKAAWRQKQYRDGLVEKKSYSFILEASVKSQLDALARRQKKTISETLEKLIKQAALRAKKAEEKSSSERRRCDW